jgi:outer membrane protein TolC
VLHAAQQVQTALRGFLLSQEQAEDLAKSAKAAVAAAEVGVKQYKAGTVPFNTVFNLETAQVQQQDNLAVAQGNIALNLVNVYRALGGGWELRMPEDTSKVGPRAVLMPPASEEGPPPQTFKRHG